MGITYAGAAQRQEAGGGPDLTAMARGGGTTIPATSRYGDLDFTARKWNT